MSPHVRALLAVLDELARDPEARAEAGPVLAQVLGDYLPQPAPEAPDGWLDTRAAAIYAGCTVDALHRAMAAREVSFAQPGGKGGKAWFTRADVDRWRRGLPPMRNVA